MCTVWIVQSIQAGTDVQERRPGHRRAVVRDPRELVRAADREAPAQLALVRAQDVDAEGPGAGDARPGRRRTGDHEGDQRRVEGEGGEGLAGESGRAVLVVRRDDGDAGREVPQYTPEFGRVDGQPLVVADGPQVGARQRVEGLADRGGGRSWPWEPRRT